MTNRLQELFEEIRELEEEVLVELKKKQADLSYELTRRSVRFKDEVLELHQQKLVSVKEYLRAAKLKHILTAPVIWLCIFPAIFMDVVVSFFQYTCFPIYGIPVVRRSAYIIIGRQLLKYLNIIEKLNCVYCGYFNGLMAYAQEVAARCEQYWCPIKHARTPATTHSRYFTFTDFGDAEDFRERQQAIRKAFDDLRNTSKESQ